MTTAGRIWTLRQSGEPQRTIARRLGVPYGTVRRICIEREHPPVKPETDAQFFARVWRQTMRRCRKAA